MGKRQKIGAVFVGAGVVWSGVGTLVVARAGEEEVVLLHGANQGSAGNHKGLLLFFGESQMGDHVSRNAGDHQGPHPAPRLPRPYGGSFHILLA